MVYQPAQPSEVKKKHERSRIVQILLDVLTLILVAGATYAIFKLTAVRPENQEANNPSVVAKTPTVEEEEEENPEWLTRTTVQWLTSYPRSFRGGVAVYDFDFETLIASLNLDLVFTRQAQSELGTRFGINFQTAEETTAEEMLEIMKAVYRHAGMSEEEYAALKEEMLAQPDIYSEERCQGYCKTRDGLPAGFKAGMVYNENYSRSNGSFFLTYRDAAIVEFKTSDGRVRHFAVVLLADGFSEQEEFAKLGTALEEAIVAHFENEPLN